MELQVRGSRGGLETPRKTPAPDAYSDLIRLNPDEWEIVEGRRSPRAGRVVLSFVMALLMGLFGYGVFAAGLGIADESSFNAGQENVSAGCQTNAVKTKLLVSRISGQAGFWATGVEVSQVDSAACDGAALEVLGLDAAKTTLGVGSEVVASGASSYVVEFSEPYADASLFERIAVVIEG